MSLASGTRLGPYEVQSAIGRGGMGEVYKARDTRLDRIVAVKVLPPDVPAKSRDDRRARFEREAKAIAGLNHSHICTVYDVGEQDGVIFLVMEHLAGETLAARLRKGPLPLDEAVRTAAEIADALAAAHKQGVVHRDLKPGNVMLTRAGAKLLDFGLARLLPAAREGTPAATTLTVVGPITGPGMVLGTVPYMAPEQLQGGEADTRSDIFAFGAVLYEMLIGRPAFEGMSQASVISAIMTVQPPAPSSLRPVIQPALDRLVQRCLEKDPDARWQSAADMAAELRWISTGSGSVPGAVLPSARAARRRRWPWIAVPAAGLAAVAVALWWPARVPAPPVLPVHTQLTFSGDLDLAVLAPDGRTLAYAVSDASGLGRVVVRDVDGGEAIEIWRAAVVLSVAWLPDGGRVVVSGRERADGPVAAWLVPRFGGPPRRLEGLENYVGYIAASPDGSRVAGASQNTMGYRVLSLTSGESLPRGVPGLRWLSTVSWNRSGDRVAVTGTADDGAAAVWISRPADGRVEHVLRQPAGTRVTDACWSPTADVLYLVREHAAAADVVRVAFTDGGPANEESILTGIKASSCQVSGDGQRLIQVRAFETANLWRLDLDQAATPAALTTGTSQFFQPDVSPDGVTTLATSSSREPAELIRIPTDGGAPGPFVANAFTGRWSPDGRRLAFISSRKGSNRVWVADRNGEKAEAIPGEAGYAFLGWWPDGRLVLQTIDSRNFRIRDLATGAEELLVADPTRGWVFDPRLSPKRDRVAVRGNRSPRPGEPPSLGLWVIGWPDRREERLLAVGSLSPIGWSADGAFIFASRNAEVVRVSAATGAVTSIGRFPVGTISGCALTPNRRAMVCSLVDSKSDAWIVDHFDPHARPAAR